MSIRSLVCCLLGLCTGVADAQDADAPVALTFSVPGLPPLSKPLRSLYALRYEHVVRQERDFTCGAAALSTILRYAFGRPVGEREIIEDMLNNTDPETVRQNGFSLLDIKKYVERIGLRGRGYQIDRHSLQTLKIPVIALQSARGGAPHFVVVMRVVDGVVHLADPALGRRRMPLDEFVAAWNGVVFAVLGAGLQDDNVLLTDAARSPAAAQRAGIVTRALPQQQEFGLLGLDTF